MNEELIRLLREFPMFVGNGFSYFISDKKEPTCIAAADALESADKRIAELEAQLGECQKDAERYRQLRDNNISDNAIYETVYGDDFPPHSEMKFGAGLDAAIDAAIKENGE